MTQLSNEPVYSTKFSTDGGLLATSFQDGTIQIVSTEFNNTLYQFDSDSFAKQQKRTCFPVTGLSWKNNFGNATADLQ